MKVRKEEVRLSLFAYGIIVCTEEFKKFIKQIVEPINENDFNKVVGHKVKCIFIYQ